MTTQQVLHRIDIRPLPPATGKTAEDTQPDPRLLHAATEFEAVMLGELLKPLHFGAAIGQDDAESGGAADTIRGMGTDALAQGIAASGGIGIAARIVRQVAAEHEAQTKIRKGTKVA